MYGAATGSVRNLGGFTRYKFYMLRSNKVVPMHGLWAYGAVEV